MNPTPFSPSRRHRVALGIAAAIPLLASIYAFSLGPSPERRLREFYAIEANEPEIIKAPLIEAGREIVPLLTVEIVKKDMPRRALAIQFVAEQRSLIALPALEAIVNDGSESSAIRTEALTAISKIDPMRGRQLAKVLSPTQTATGL